MMICRGEEYWRVSKSYLDNCELGLNCAAILVESRQQFADKALENHQEFIPKDWDIKRYNYPINSLSDYNRLLTSESFWKGLQYDKVLIFQHDSRLLRHGIEEFLQWDYIGAPWTFQHKGGNGGLSIRTPEVMLRVIQAVKYDESKHGHEDCYFSNQIESVGGNLAPREECLRFSCEAIYQLGTVGCHAIEKYLKPEHVKQVLAQYEKAN